MVILSMIMAAFLQAATPEEVEIPGPEGPISGTLIDPSPDAPAIVLTAGSGPTDRNGDNPLASKGEIYRQLAEALAEKGIATLRFDKRGMFGSAEAIPNANNVRLADYAADAHAWAAMLRERGKPCAWLMGHSEGGIVSVLAAQDPEGICGVILLAAPGRPVGVLLREQLGAQLPPAMMEQVDTALAKMEAGETVDPDTVPAPVRMIFNPEVQPFLMDMAQTDAAAIAGGGDYPLLIVHFEEDLQVVAADADAFAAARPDASRIDLDGVNHVMKNVPPGDLMANRTSYGDADARIDPRIAEAIAAFVKVER